MSAFFVASAARGHDARTCSAARSYERRQPERDVLFTVLQKQLDTFIAKANAADSGGCGAPGFVQKELR